MKQSSLATLVVVASCAALSVTACKSKNSNAANNDTTSTYMQPRQDNATVKPDTAQVQLPAKDSLDTTGKRGRK